MSTYNKSARIGPMLRAAARKRQDAAASTRQEFLENALLVLADYQTCKKDDGRFRANEGDGRQQSEEIAKRIVDNYVTIVKPKERPKDAELRIEQMLYDEALHEMDAWAACRNPPIRQACAEAFAGVLFKRGA